ncbi:MAG TPA: thiamine phosphate synthase [Gaiellaceae bacterium]|nr:thiamine phosphate synthase [Gaiellaceae bacterium]
MLRERLERALLYLVTDSPEPVEPALAGGVDIVQLRVKDADDDEIVELGRVVRGLTRAAGALFVLNDRPGLAVACDADGVHVGQGDAAVAEARAAVGPERLVGLSIDAPGQLAGAAGADYLGVGPVYATPTKPGAQAAGLEIVREAARVAAVPWFAIGGIDETTLDEVTAAGARRVAVVRAVRDAADPAAAAAALRRRLERL